LPLAAGNRRLEQTPGPSTLPEDHGRSPPFSCSGKLVATGDQFSLRQGVRKGRPDGFRCRPLHRRQDVGMLGAFAGSARIFAREDARLDFTEALLFKRNQVTFRAELRMGLGVLRPKAFVEITLS
jgi:HK97 family phage major capsid protein